MKGFTEPADQQPTIGQRIVTSLAWALVLGVGLALVLAHAELGLPAHGWSLKPQPYHPYSPLGLLLPGLTFGLLGWAMYRAAKRPTRAKVTGVVGLLVLWHFWVSLALDTGGGRQVWLVNALATTLGQVSNGYYEAACQISDPRSFVSSYPELQRTAGYKVSTHPPGAILCYWLPRQLWQSSPAVQRVSQRLLEWLAEGDINGVYLTVTRYPTVPAVPAGELGAVLWCVLSIAFCGALAVPACYLLGKQIHSVPAGLLSAGLGSLLPSSLFYALSLDVILMALTGWAAVALQAGLAAGRREVALGGLAGGLLGLAVSISLGAIASVALVGGLGLSMLLCRQTTVRHLLLVAAGLALGLLVIDLAWRVLGLDVVAVVRNGLGAHQHGAGGTGHRPYWPWAAWNLVDYALLVGPAVVLVAIAGLRAGQARPLSLAVVVVLILLSASGIVKGETERLWIFANPLVAAAAAVTTLDRAGWFATLASQPLWLVLTALSLPPLVRPY